MAKLLLRETAKKGLLIVYYLTDTDEALDMFKTVIKKTRNNFRTAAILLM